MGGGRSQGAKKLSPAKPPLARSLQPPASLQLKPKPKLKPKNAPTLSRITTEKSGCFGSKVPALEANGRNPIRIYFLDKLPFQLGLFSKGHGHADANKAPVFAFKGLQPSPIP